jgi:hypothetical protein
MLLELMVVCRGATINLMELMIVLYLNLLHSQVMFMIVNVSNVWITKYFPGLMILKPEKHVNQYKP